MNDKKSSTGESSNEKVPPLVACSECGHMVPETNLELHRAAGCTHCQLRHHNHNQQQQARDDEETMVQETSPPTVPTVLCEKCGKRIPTMNQTIHMASCHRAGGAEEESSSPSSHQSEMNTTQQCFEEIQQEASKWNVSQLKQKLQDLGVNIRGMVEKMELIQAYARAVVERGVGGGDPSSSSRDASEEGVQVMEQDGAIETVAAGYGRSASSATTTSSTAASMELDEQQQQEHQESWSCPRCTLLNPISSRQCDACLYNRNHEGLHHHHHQHQHHISHPPNTTTEEQESSPQQENGGIRVEVSEMDPRVVNVVGSTAAVVSWGLLGGMLGGPVGALTGATIAGMTRLNNYRLEQAGRSIPRSGFVFTTISQTPTGGTTISTTTSSNNRGAGGMRTVRISGASLDQMTPADQRILQMLLMNAMSQGAHGADQMSYDELLERFGVGTERRGASSEAINGLPLATMDSEKLQELQENQKCCNICLEDFKEDDQVRTLHCDHVFHQQCIDRWLSQVASCPICKRELEGTRESSEPQPNPTREAHA